MSMSKNEMIIEIEKMLIIPQPHYRICIDSLRDAHMYLKEPTLPVVPSDAVLEAITDARGHSSVNTQGNRKVYDAIRAALLTPPKPKMKTVWKFSYTFAEKLPSLKQNRVCVFDTEFDAIQDRRGVIAAAKSTEYTNISPIWSEEVEDK